MAKLLNESPKFNIEKEKQFMDLVRSFLEILSLKAFCLKRDVTREEFGWIERDYKMGEIIYEYTGCTYGCIGKHGKAFSEKPNRTPFFELPPDCVE